MRRRKLTAGVEPRLVRNARPLFTVQADHPYWDGKTELHDIYRAPENWLQGAIVRVLPPAHATREQIDMLTLQLQKLDVLKVHVMPKEPGPALVTDRPELPEDVSIREVVEDMVVEANTDDREGLHAIIEDALTQEGL